MAMTTTPAQNPLIHAALQLGTLTAAPITKPAVMDKSRLALLNSMKTCLEQLGGHLIDARSIAEKFSPLAREYWDSKPSIADAGRLLFGESFVSKSNGKPTREYNALQYAIRVAFPAERKPAAPRQQKSPGREDEREIASGLNALPNDKIFSTILSAAKTLRRDDLIKLLDELDRLVDSKM